MEVSREGNEVGLVMVEVDGGLLPFSQTLTQFWTFQVTADLVNHERPAEASRACFMYDCYFWTPSA